MLSWSGWLNFLILQWFGVRLARVYNFGKCKASCDVCTELTCRYRELIFSHYELLAWIWPLTGWWGRFRWIKRTYP